MLYGFYIVDNQVKANQNRKNIRKQNILREKKMFALTLCIITLVVSFKLMMQNKKKLCYSNLIYLEISNQSIRCIDVL